MENKTSVLWSPVTSPFNTHQVGKSHSKSDKQDLVLITAKSQNLELELTLTHDYQQAWVDRNFKKKERPELVIFQSDNVLTPRALKEVKENMNLQTNFLSSDAGSA